MPTISPLFFWARTMVKIKGTMFEQSVDAWQHGSNMALAVTPLLTPAGIDAARFVITHVPSGARIWPDAFPETTAKALLLDLAQLPGWQAENAFENSLLVHHAKRIATPYALNEKAEREKSQREKLGIHEY